MKRKTTIALSVSILATSAFYSISQNAPPDRVAQAFDQTGHVRRPVESPDGSIPYRTIDPETGILLNARGVPVEDQEINSAERREERLFARFIIENPEEYWKVTNPVFPERKNPNSQPFDILRPHQHTAAVFALEGRDDRGIRERATLAIVNPIEYERLIKEKGQSIEE